MRARSLKVRWSGTMLWDMRMPSLKYVSIWQEVLLEEPFKDMKLRSLGILTWEDRSEGGEEENNLTESENLLRII